MQLEGCRILVTGGGRAIGRRIALRAAEVGADVALIGREARALEQTALEIRALGPRAVAEVADVSEEEQVATAVARVLQDLGSVDVLINNAAILGPTLPVQEVSRAEWDRVLAVNLTGAFLCSRAVLPTMLARRSGKIINISSVAGKIAYPLRAPYAASKWGLIGFTRTLAKELGPFHIQVNAVCPGPVRGARMETVIGNRAQQLGRSIPEVEADFLQASALGRMVEEDDIASLVLFLASPLGDNITGEAIDVTAGFGI